MEIGEKYIYLLHYLSTHCSLTTSGTGLKISVIGFRFFS